VRVWLRRPGSRRERAPSPADPAKRGKRVYLPLNDAQIVIRVAGDQEAEGAMTAQAA
jgi:hypothetical protein